DGIRVSSVTGVQTCALPIFSEADCSAEPIRPPVSNADALALMVETMLAADHSKDISRHERTLVMVHVDAATGDAHLHDGPTLDEIGKRRVGKEGKTTGSPDQ